MTKHVFTSSTPSETWSASTFVDAPAAGYVAELKQQPGGDIGIHGSISLAQSPLEAHPSTNAAGDRADGVGRTTTGSVIAGYAKR
jgi:hypothetical protein